MTIARGAKVIFVNIDIDEAPANLDRDEGFHLWKEDAWEWIYDNQAKYDIDVISISLGNKEGKIEDDMRQNFWFNDWISKLRSSGVFIAAAMGNDGTNKNSYLTSHPDIFGVGSIDHEDRGGWRKTTKRIGWFSFTYSYWDDDYQSVKGQFSGWSDQALELGCSHEAVYCSSYGGSSETDPFKTDFVMPGNGVPVALDVPRDDNWVYATGTSISTPYLSAAALIAISAYNMGYHSKSGQYRDPSVNKLYDLLKWASSQNGILDQCLGYGYVDLVELYNEAYQRGYNDAPSYVPPPCTYCGVIK